MSPSKKILSKTGEPLLSLRRAAKVLHCAPDYVGKLCREGKLEGQRIGSAWFVDQRSLAKFSASRVEARAVRAQSLSHERRIESQQYRNIYGTPTAQPPASAVVAAPTPTPTPTPTYTHAVGRSASNILSTLTGKTAALALGSLLLFSAVTFAATVATTPGNIFAGAQKNLAASLAQIESPFFANNPLASNSSGEQSSGFPNFFSALFSLFFPPTAPQVAQQTSVPQSAPQIPPTLAVATSTTTSVQQTSSAPKQTIVENNTYPVIQRTVIQPEAGAITQALLTQQLSALSNSLTQLIYSNESAPNSLPSSGGYQNNIALSNKIDQLQNVTITNSTITGGSISGLTGLDLASGCFSVAGVCITSGGSAAGGNGALQFNNSGAFGGSAQLVWDNADSRLGIGTSTPQSALSLGAGGVIRLTSNNGSTNGCFEEIGGQLEYANDCSSFQSFTASAAGGWTDTGTVVHLTTNAESAGIGTTTPYAKLTVWGSGTGSENAFQIANAASTTLLSVNDAGQTTLVSLVATASTTLQNATSTSLYTSTLGLNSAYLTSFTGSGLVITGGALGISNATVNGLAAALIDASTTIPKTSAAPTYGQVLVGNSSGGYSLLATSSLGISGGSGFSGGTLTAANIISTSTATSTYAGDINVAGEIVATNLSITGNIQAVGFGSCTLKTDSSGNIICGTDLTGGGGGTDVNWTFFNGSGIRPATTTNQVLIGGTSTSSLAKLEVQGSSYFNGLVGIGTTSPYLPLSVAGSAVIGGNLTFSSLTSTSTATSTFGGGINLSSGCFEVNGTCVGTGSGSATLAGLSDVTLSTPVFGNLLEFNGTKWVNVATSTLGISGGSGFSGGTLTAANIISTSTATSTYAGGVNVTGGCLAINGACLSAGSLTNYWSFSGSNLTNNAGTNIGIDNASPAFALDVSGSININSASSYRQNGLSILSASSTNFATLVGIGAGASNTVNGLDNTAVGYQALNANASASRLTAVGYQALLSDVTGADNAAFGASALAANVSGSQNSAFGSGSLLSNITGANDTALGYNALSSNTTGTRNTAVGSGALAAAIAQNDNTALGYNALSADTSGNQNTAVGSQALGSNVSGNQNIAVGASALAANISGYENIAVGVSALTANTSGVENVAVGYNALTANTSGVENVAIASNALAANTTGIENIAVGKNALITNTTGFQNAALGYNALGGNITGTQNSAFGFGTLFNNGAATSSVAIGYRAGFGVSGQSASQNNTFVGFQSGFGNTTGNNNTLLGYSAGSNLTSGSGNTVLGYNLLLPSATANNQLVIANLLYGTNANGTGSQYSTGQLGVGTSSPFARFAIHLNNGDTNTMAFAIGSSTASATTTLFSIDNTGLATLTNLLLQGSTTLQNFTAVNSTTTNATSTSFFATIISTPNLIASSSLSAGTTTLTNLTVTNLSTSSFAGGLTLGGNAFVYQQSTGNVGIGTTSPSATFAVQGNSYHSGTSFFGGAITATSTLNIVGAITSTATAANVFPFASSTALTVSGTGYFGQAGIGTTSPSATFAVQGNSYHSGTSFFGGAITATSTLNIVGAITSTATAANVFPFASSTALTVSGTGYFGQAGIGTTSPFAALSVNGSGFFGGNLTATNITATGTLNVTGLTTLGNASTTQISSTASAYFATTGGNVGIGTTSPFAALSVNGSGFFGGNLTATNITATGTLSVPALTISGTGINMLLSTNSSGSVVSTSTPTAAAYLATSTTATSTFAGGFNVATGGLLYDLSTHNVGVGTTSPATKLDVWIGSSGATAAANTQLSVESAGNTGISLLSPNSASSFLYFSNTDASNRGFIGYRGSGVGTSPDSMIFQTSGSFTFQGGNVGIGTASPVNNAGYDTLSINGTSGGVLQLQNNTTNAFKIYSDTSGDYLNGQGAVPLELFTNGLERARIDSSGNVGIGTTTLFATLAVNPVAGAASNQFVVGSSTATAFLINNSGNVGIGTTSPWGHFSIDTSSLGVGVPEFAIGSSTRSDLTINQSGQVTIGGTASSSVGQFSVMAGSSTVSRIGQATLFSGGIESDSIAVQGRYAYIAEGSGNTKAFEIFDVSNPASPVRISQSNLADGDGNNGGDGIAVAGHYAYIAESSGTANAFEIFDVSNPASTTRMSQSTLSQGNITGSNDSISVVGRYAYIAEGTGTANAFQIFDVSNPSAPVLVGQSNLAQGTGAGLSDTISVVGRYAYIVENSSATNAFQIFDVSNPTTPTLASQTTLGHNGDAIAIQGRYAYITEDQTGTNNFEIYDVSNPGLPVRVSQSSLNAWDGEAITVQGRYAYITIGGNGSKGFEIWDVSNPSIPLQLNTYALTNGANTGNSIAVQGRYAYIAEGSGASNAFEIFDLGGEYAQQLEAGGIETGTLSVRNDLSAVDGSFTGGLTAGGSLSITGSASFLSATSTFNTTANIFNIATASSTNPIFSVLGNGNVGIGTTSPFAALSVNGSGFFGGNLTATNITATGTLNVTGLTTLGNASTTQISSTASAYFATTGGNVGIGTTSPSATFAVQGNSYHSGTSFFGGAITATSTLNIVGAITSTATAANVFPFASSTALTISGTGYFGQAGIGTTSPFAALSVNGSGFFGGNLTATNITATGTLNVTGLTTLGNASTTQISSTASAYFATTGGNVGIGTTSPFAALSVNGSGFFGGNLTATNITATGTLSVPALTISGTGINMLLSTNSSGSVVSTSTPTAAAYLATSTTATSTFAGGFNVATGGLLYDLSTHNVGVGTTSPATKLDVWIGSSGATAAANTQLSVESAGNTGISLLSPNSASSFLYFSNTDASNRGFIGYRGSGVGTSPDSMIFQTSGSFTFQGGNVGIGTASPVNNAGYDTLSINGTSGGVLQLQNNTTNAFKIYSDTSGDYLNGQGAVPLELFTNGLERARIDSSGNVGIGTTTLFATLAVNPVAGAASNQFVVGSSTATAFLINNSGNVGIGTTSPFAALSVNGSGFFGGNLTATNITATGTLNVTGLTTLGNASTTQISSTASAYFATTGGNVGIGTTSPSATFAVQGNSYHSGTSFFGGAITATSTLNIVGAITSTATAANVFPFASSTALTISGTGYFGQAGIGTTSPWGHFSIDTSSLGVGVPEFAIGSSTRSDLTVTQAGNVGIASTSPWEALSVNGGLVVTGTQPTIIGATSPTTSTFTGLNGNNLLWVATSTTLAEIAATIQVDYEGSASVNIQGINAAALWGTNATANNTGVVSGGGVRNRYLVANDSTGYNVAEMSAVSAGAIFNGVDASSTDVADFNAENPATFTSGNLVTDFYGLWVRGGSVAGTLTNRYGVYVDNLVGGTNRWGIYQAGASDNNYFAGNTGVGTTSPYANLSVFTGGDYASHPLSTLFAIGSSTAGTATSTLFNVLSSGNVGIGTTSPFAALSVNGSGFFGGSLTASVFSATSTVATSTFAGGVQVNTFSVTGGIPALPGSLGAFGFTNSSAFNCTLKTDSTGSLYCGTDLTGGAGSGGSQWTDVNSTPTYGVRLATTSSQVLLGAAATTSLAALEVIQTGSNPAAYFKGNVGIGTTSPFAALSVNGSGFFGGNLTATNITATGTLNVTGLTTLGNASTTQISSTASAYFATTGGNVGIGTTTPFATLSVNPTAGNASNQFAVGSSSATSFIINNSGSVGIGTSTPGALFAVQGNGYFTGNVQADGNVNVAAGKCFSVAGVCIGYITKIVGIYSNSAAVSNDTITFGTAASPTGTFSGNLVLPATTTQIVVEVWGAGGGGGGGSNNVNGLAPGGGGGSGGYSRKLVTNPSGTYYYTTGSGGTGQGFGNPGTAGNSGNVSCFQTTNNTCSTGLLAQANGGGGGGGGNYNGTVTVVGGPGTAASTGIGDVVIAGSAGQSGQTTTYNIGGGSNPIYNTAADGGNGGSAPAGGGGGSGVGSAGGGSAGSAFGGGGGGGDYNTNGFNGGTGGLVITVYATSSPTAAGNDYAEMYPVSNPAINAGDIVSVDPTTPISMKLAQQGDTALAGIVSTNPGQVLGDQTITDERPIALSGRVPTFVNLENGPISIGDRITMSSTPGVGMKAGPFDPSVGIALESYDGTQSSNEITVFINIQQGVDISAVTKNVLSNLASSSTSSISFGTAFASSTFTGFLNAATTTTGALSITSVGGITFADGSVLTSANLSTSTLDLSNYITTAQLSDVLATIASSTLDQNTQLSALNTSLENLASTTSLLASGLRVDTLGNVTIGGSASSTLTISSGTVVINAGTVAFSGPATTTIVVGQNAWTIATSTATGTVPIVSISTGTTTLLNVNGDIKAQSIEVSSASTSQLCIGGTCFNGVQAAALALEASSTATTTDATSTPAAIESGFASVSSALQSALSSALNAVVGIGQSGVRELGLAVHAGTGVFNQLFAQTITVDTVQAQKLCLGETCVTEPQLQALLELASTTSAGSGSGSDNSGSASTTPPTITLNGDNPATINISDTYADLGGTISGPGTDSNLTLMASVNGGATTTAAEISIDTSATSTDTIIYSATDQNGLVGYSTRIVNVVDPNATSTQQ